MDTIRRASPFVKFFQTGSNAFKLGETACFCSDFQTFKPAGQHFCCLGQLANQQLDVIVSREGIVMKKIIFPLSVLILGLAVAKFFFGVDVEGLAEGFIDFLSDILNGPG